MMPAPSAVIVDVDGTLTVRRWGGASPDVYRPEVWDPTARTPHEWHRVREDLPNQPMVELTQRLYVAGLAIVVTSGRSEVCRDATEEWLTRHGIPYAELHMATVAESNGRVQDSAVKRRIHAEHIAGKWRVVAAFDDRDQVVSVWRELGIMCAQVAPGDF